MTKLLVVLDINGVLVDSTHKNRPGVQADARARYKAVYFRPGLRAFINWLMALPGVAVGIWTSNIRENADAIVNLIFTPEQKHRLAFVFSRAECITFPDYSSQKPAQRVFDLGYDPRQTIFVDDSAEKVVHPLKSAFYFPVPEFVASPASVASDTGLADLRRVILEKLQTPA